LRGWEIKGKIFTDLSKKGRKEVLQLFSFRKIV
jgi:hypothetical protein